MSAARRNDPCPCGSGAKYKRCCGAAAREGYTANDREAALREMDRFSSREEFERAIDIATMLFWGDWPTRLGRARLDELCRSAQVVRNQKRFLQADFPVDGDDTLVDEFLRRRGSALPDGQRRYLRNLRASHLGVYEVREVGPDDGLLLRNLWTDEEELWVRAELLPRGAIRPGDVLVARVLRRPSGESGLEDDFYPFPARFKETILRQLEADRRGSEGLDLVLAPGAFLKRVSFRFHGLWLSSRAPTEPRRSRAQPRYPYLSAHLLDYLDGGDLSFRVPSPARRIGLYLGRIVAGVTRGDAPPDEEGIVWTGVDCRRRPGRHPCAGEVMARVDEKHRGLLWTCSSCGDAGTISSWQGSAFDLSARAPAEQLVGRALVRREVVITADDYRRLLRLSHLTAGALALLVGDRQEGETAILNGSFREYAELASCIEHQLAAGNPSPSAAERLTQLRSALLWAAHEAPHPPSRPTSDLSTPPATDSKPVRARPPRTRSSVPLRSNLHGPG